MMSNVLLSPPAASRLNCRGCVGAALCGLTRMKRQLGHAAAARRSWASSSTGARRAGRAANVCANSAESTPTTGGTGCAACVTNSCKYLSHALNVVHVCM